MSNQPIEIDVKCNWCGALDKALWSEQGAVDSCWFCGADATMVAKVDGVKPSQDYGVSEIQAIQTAIDFLSDDPARAELVEGLESAILAIRTHILPETNEMAVN